jgi:SnoaL-like domain
VSDASLLDRIDRIESQLAIQQLPPRYALAVDSRDLDAWVELFVDDVNCGRHGQGREALKRWIDPQLRTFYRSHHQICGQVIDFIDADHATGTVYCRAEHEDGSKWIVMLICYFDSYERRQGQWYFTRRNEQHWYSSDIIERPAGPNFQRWPGRENEFPHLPARFPSWTKFWADSEPDAIARLTGEPV